MNRRATLLCAFLLLVSGIALAQLRIGGHDVAYDATAGRLLCAVPHDVFGADFTATVEVTDGTWSDVVIDGMPVSGVQPVTFAAVGPGHAYTVTANTANGKSVSAQLLFTYHPIVDISLAKVTTDYQPCTVRVLQPDTCIASAAKIKTRGGYTNQSWLHKKNFHLKFVDEAGEKRDVKLLGLRSDNSWILDAGQVEETRMRNHVATELWNDFAHKPYYADVEPKARSGVRGEPVEVMLGGQYFGVYVLTEAMDRKQLKLRKYDEATGEIHGQLWKTVTKTPTTLLTGPAAYCDTLDTWDGVETKYPELDEVCPTDYSVLATALRAIAEAPDVKAIDSVAAERFDMPVVLDYVLLLHTLLANDNIAKNIYWACRDRGADDRLTLAVWDLDATVGHTWNAYGRRFDPTSNLLAENRLFGALTDDRSAYKNELLRRYSELRFGAFSTEALQQRYADKIAWLQGSGAADREVERWSGDHDLSYHTIDYDYELAWLTDWIARRMEYLDNGLFAITLPGDADLNGVVDISDLNLTQNVILGLAPLSRLSDADQNGIIDIGDVNLIIDKILHP